MTRTSLFAATLLFAAFSTSADAVALGDDQSPEMTLTREPMGMPTPMIEFVEHNPTLQSATIPFVDDEGRYFEALVNLSNRGYVVRNAAGQTVGSGTISIARRDLLLDMLSEDDDGVIDCTNLESCATELLGFVWGLIEETQRRDAAWECSAAYRSALSDYIAAFNSCLNQSRQTGVLMRFDGTPPQQVGCGVLPGNTSCTPV
ncbi:MAG: hypothetical protein ABIJ73_12390 [Pseudomonadota bacterium]